MKTAGVPDAQGKAQAEALADQDLPTKADIAELKAELKAHLAKF